MLSVGVVVFDVDSHVSGVDIEAARWNDKPGVYSIARWMVDILNYTNVFRRGNLVEVGDYS